MTLLDWIRALILLSIIVGIVGGGLLFLSQLLGVHLLYSF